LHILLILNNKNYGGRNKIYEDPNFLVMDFFCSYCGKEITITVHEDGSCICHNCNLETTPPMTYEEAKNKTEQVRVVLIYAIL